MVDDAADGMIHENVDVVRWRRQTLRYLLGSAHCTAAR